VIIDEAGMADTPSLDAAVHFVVQRRRASPPDDLAVCRDRTPPMRSSLHASPRKLIMTNYQRGIPSTPMKAAAVVRAESLSPASFPNQSAASARCWI
jgi:hypothetical protein